MLEDQNQKQTTPLERFSDRQVDALLDSVRYTNVLCLLTRLDDPFARQWIHMTLLGMAMLFAPTKATAPEPTKETLDELPEDTTRS